MEEQEMFDIEPRGWVSYICWVQTTASSVRILKKTSGARLSGVQLSFGKVTHILKLPRGASQDVDAQRKLRCIISRAIQRDPPELKQFLQLKVLTFLSPFILAMLYCFSGQIRSLNSTNTNTRALWTKATKKEDAWWDPVVWRSYQTAWD